MSRTAEVVVCGAGIAGISAAYHLVKAGYKDILIVDPRPPLSLTSDVSTEGYRNWWPDPQLAALMNHSIDLLEQLAAESGNIFRMNRRGYLYVTADEAGLRGFLERATRAASVAGGALRHHYGRQSSYQPDSAGFTASGADLLLEPALIREYFPYLTDKSLAALHVRRAGWLSAQQLGMYLLERARQAGVSVEACEVQAIDMGSSRVQGVRLSSGESVACGGFVNAAGPFVPHVGKLMGMDIPVHAELHLKVSFRDHLGVIPRNAPMVIWSDAQSLPWDAEERAALHADEESRWLVEPFPPGVHMRPEGSAESQTVLMLWDYAARPTDPTFPVPLDDSYPEVVLRGLATMLPGLKQYFARAPRPYVDGGYYMKTRENRLLVGPLAAEGAYVIGGLSGYGIMSCLAAGELLAAHVRGSALPAYAPAFSPDRYQRPGYEQELAQLDTGGEL